MKITSLTQVRHAGRFAIVSLLMAALLLLPMQPLHASAAGAERNAKILFDALRTRGWHVRDSYSYGFLKRGAYTVIQTQLLAGNHYKICAAGCEDAADVDISVFDENENLIDGDHDNSVLAVADITPKWSGTFYVKVTMYDSTPGGAHYVVQYAYE